jgi:hypothetical protein
MIDMIVFIAPIIASLVLILVSVLILLTTINDTMEIGRHKQVDRRRRNTTVIVLADDARSLERCLKSIGEAGPGRYDIVVVDRHLTNDHRAIRNIATSNTRTVLYRPRKRHDDEHLLKLAYARSHKAETVLVAHDSVRFVSGPSGKFVPTWNSAALATPVRLRSSSNLEGFVGVVTTLRNSVEGLLDSSLRIIRMHRQVKIEGRAYMVSAVTIKKSRMFVNGWRYDVRAPRLLVDTIPSFVKFNIKNIGSWLAFGLSVAIGYVLVVASINHHKTEPLMLVWLMISIGSVGIVLFDPFLRSAQKISPLVCIGFMPILALLSIVIKTRRT